jgi:hypothetical protein
MCGGSVSLKRTPPHRQRPVSEGSVTADKSAMQVDFVVPCLTINAVRDRGRGAGSDTPLGPNRQLACEAVKLAISLRSPRANSSSSRSGSTAETSITCSRERRVDSLANRTEPIM